MMSKALMEARQKFRGQRGKLDDGAGFDNSNLPEGKYTCEVVQSEIQDKKDGDGKAHPIWYRRIVVKLGDKKGRSLFPFKPALDNPDHLMSAAKDLRRILGGGAVPGRDLPNNEFELDYDKFLANVEGAAAQCIGQLIEVQVKDNKKADLKDDGTCWQNVYVNRGLGEDAQGVKDDPEEEASRKDAEDIGMKAKSSVRKTVIKKR